MLREIIDLFFDPIINVLSNMNGYLQEAVIVGSRGIDLGNYFGFLGWMGSDWGHLVASLVMCSAICIILYVVRAGIGLYMTIKQGIKWW